MIANALELTRLPVELEAVLRCVRDRADTKAGVDFVEHNAIFAHACAGNIKIRCLRTPEVRVSYFCSAFRAMNGSDHLILEKDIRYEFYTFRFRCGGLYAVLEFSGKSNLGALWADFRRTHEHAESRYMYRVGLYEVHIAVQTCARIPTALLGFVLQKDINIHAVADDQLR